MPRNRLLDLFCGAGGATMGYRRAGFEIVGVDIQPQPRYCGDYFVQMDALEWADWDGFALVHASPPCQGFSSTKHLPWLKDKVYLDLLTPTRLMLDATGVPYVIENVPGAPMRVDVILCGTMFNLRVLRHRWFEIEPKQLILTPPCNHWGTVKDKDFWCVVGNGQRNVPKHNAVTWYANKATASWAMGGLDWMTRREMVQAVPPAYTEFIGRHLLERRRHETSDCM